MYHPYFFGSLYRLHPVYPRNKIVAMTYAPTHVCVGPFNSARCFQKTVFLFLFRSRRTAYIVRDNARIFTSVGLSYKDVILFSKIFYVFDVVYVKSNGISR